MRLHERIKSLIGLRVDGSIIGLDKRGKAAAYTKKRNETNSGASWKIIVCELFYYH